MLIIAFGVIGQAGVDELTYDDRKLLDACIKLLLLCFGQSHYAKVLILGK